MNVVSFALACLAFTGEARRRNTETRSHQGPPFGNERHHAEGKEKSVGSYGHRRSVAALLSFLFAFRPAPLLDQRRNAAMSRKTFSPTALVGEAAAGLAFAGLAAFAFQGVGPSDEALTAMQSTTMRVSNRSDGGLLFEPLEKPCVGLVVFYAGAKIAPSSYAPLAQAVVDLGASMLVVQSPFSGNPPFQGGIYAFKPPSVSQILDDLDPALYSSSYMIAGHSIGGLWAIEYCRDLFEDGDWQKVPSSSNSLKPAINFCHVGVHGPDLAKFKDIPFASTTYLYATNDWTLQAARKKRDDSSESEELESIDEYVARVVNSQLPAGSTLVAIEGGNHAQYGSYGLPGRPNGYFQDEIEASADMPEHRQREIVAKALVAPLR